MRYERDGHEVEGTPSAKFELLTALDAPLDPALLPESGEAGSQQSGSHAASSSRTGTGASDAESGWRDRARRASLAATGPAESAVRIPANPATSRAHSRPSFVPARN
jgi:hypothetical protein